MGQISSAPVELIRVQRSGGKSWRGAVAEMQGWRADHEDAHFMRNEASEGGFSIFGVLDGHGGCEVARLAAHAQLPEALRRATDGAARAELERRVAAAFVETDAWLRERPEVTRDQSGSTCVVAGLRRRDDDGSFEAFIANAGDSRGIALRRRANDAPPEIIAASEDHKPDRDDERARISAAGGFVSDANAAKRAHRGAIAVVARLDGNLAVSRGLGDFAYKRDARRTPKEQKVSCVPEFYPLRGDEQEGGGQLLAGDLVVLACDGIFDVMTNEVLARAIVQAVDRGDDLGDVASAIVHNCLHELNSKDNMTLMIVQVGVDGSDYAYTTSTDDGRRRRPRDDDLDSGAPRPDPTSAVRPQENDDDDDDDHRATDEIVGIAHYERQNDETVKRSYIAFLEYCEADEDRRLPKEARDLLRRVSRDSWDVSARSRDALHPRRRPPTTTPGAVPTATRTAKRLERKKTTTTATRRASRGGKHRSPQGQVRP